MRDPQYVQPGTSKAEYFALEAKSDTKHELWWGEMVAMAGALPPHNTITAQASRALNNRLDGTPCQAGVSDLRLAVDDAENYVYPDVVVWCDDAQWNERGDTLLTPLVIIEVLSSGTQLRDRRDKLNAYCELPSLRDYLMISPESVSIDHYSRAGEADAWMRHHYTRRAQIVRLAAFDLEIEVAEFYRRLDVPEGLRALARED